jgi:hypothetical protein
MEPPAGETADGSRKHFDTRINNANGRKLELPVAPPRPEFTGFSPPKVGIVEHVEEVSRSVPWDLKRLSQKISKATQQDRGH